MTTYMQNKTVVLDSSSLISLLKPDDQLHTDAIEINKTLKKNGWQIVLPVDVLSETLNILGKRLGKAVAANVAMAVLGQIERREVSLYSTTSDTFRSAKDIFDKATGGPSFTDCIVIAVADHFQTKYIFGFDATFRRNGYLLP